MIIRTGGAVAALCAMSVLAGCGGGSGSSAATAPGETASETGAAVATGAAVPTTTTAPAVATSTAAAPAAGGATTLWGVRSVGQGGSVMCAAAGSADVYNPALVAGEAGLRCTAGAVSGSTRAYSCAIDGENQSVSVAVSGETPQGFTAQMSVGGESMAIIGVNSGRPCPSGWAAGDMMSGPRGIVNITTGQSREAPSQPPPEVTAVIQQMQGGES